MASNDYQASPEFQALTDVLEAERSAEAQLIAARSEANTIIQNAQDAARAIETATDRRIQALHSRFRGKLKQRKSDLDQSFQQEQSARSAKTDTGLVRHVTNQLAHSIVGVAKG